MFKNDPRAWIFTMVAQRFCCTNLSYRARLTGMRNCGPEINCLVDRCSHRLSALHRLFAHWILLSYLRSLSLVTTLRKSTKQTYATPSVVCSLLTTTLSGRGVSQAPSKIDLVPCLATPNTCPDVWMSLLPQNVYTPPEVDTPGTFSKAVHRSPCPPILPFLVHSVLPTFSAMTTEPSRSTSRELLALHKSTRLMPINQPTCGVEPDAVPEVKVYAEWVLRSATHKATSPSTDSGSLVGTPSHLSKAHESGHPKNLTNNRPSNSFPLECGLIAAIDYESMFEEPTRSLSSTPLEVIEVDMLSGHGEINGTVAPEPSSQVCEIIHISRDLVSPRISHHRLIIEIFINGEPCEALVDSGASVSGLSLSFYQRSQLPPTQPCLSPLVCRTVTGETVDTRRMVPQLLLAMGAFESKEDLLVLPISRSYDVLLGMDFLSRHRAVLYCDPQRPTCLTLAQGSALRTTPSPDRTNGHDICTMEGSSKEAIPLRHELKVLSTKKFHDCRNQLHDQRRGAEFDPLSSKPYLVHVMCMESLHRASPRRRPEPKPPPWPTIDVAELSISFDADAKAEPGAPVHDPFTMCPPEVVREVNKPRKDCVKLLRQFRDRKYPCFSGMPHESKIKRQHEVPMSIELKDEFKDASPPRGRTYKTPIHLLPILKKSLSEMLKAGWIRPSRSEWCAPILIIPKPHQDLKSLSVDEVKYHVCVDLSDLNSRTKTLFYRVPDVTTAWDKLS